MTVSRLSTNSNTFFSLASSAGTARRARPAPSSTGSGEANPQVIQETDVIDKKRVALLHARADQARFASRKPSEWCWNFPRRWSSEAKRMPSSVLPMRESRDPGVRPSPRGSSNFEISFRDFRPRPKNLR